MKNKKVMDLHPIAGNFVIVHQFFSFTLDAYDVVYCKNIFTDIQ